jgi:DNA-directed RNA polymerase subunit RPC12/RpoP
MNIQDAIMADFEVRKAAIDASVEPAIHSPSLRTPVQLLAEKAGQVCSAEGISYLKLKPIQRLFLTHYRCHKCKLLPLYCLDMAHLKHVRCRACGHQVSFTNSGKYGRLRKKIALSLSREGLVSMRR